MWEATWAEMRFEEHSSVQALPLPEAPLVQTCAPNFCHCGVIEYFFVCVDRLRYSKTLQFDAYIDGCEEERWLWGGTELAGGEIGKEEIVGEIRIFEPLVLLMHENLKRVCPGIVQPLVAIPGELPITL